MGRCETRYTKSEASTSSGEGREGDVEDDAVKRAGEKLCVGV